MIDFYQRPQHHTGEYLWRFFCLILIALFRAEDWTKHISRWLWVFAYHTPRWQRRQFFICASALEVCECETAAVYHSFYWWLKLSYDSYLPVWVETNWIYWLTMTVKCTHKETIKVLWSALYIHTIFHFSRGVRIININGGWVYVDIYRMRRRVLVIHSLLRSITKLGPLSSAYTPPDHLTAK